MIESITFSEYLHDIELVVVGGEADKSARPLNYNQVLQIRQPCISHNVNFEFRQCGTHFIKDGKSTHYLLVTYAVKREKPISIIERHLSFLCKDREEKFINKPYNVNNKDKLLSAKRKMRGQEVSHGMG